MSTCIAMMLGPFGRIGLTEMDTPLVTHVHPHLHVIAKLGGADTVFQVCGADQPVTDETVVLVNMWEPHAWRSPRSAEPTRFLTLYLEPNWLAAIGLSGVGPDADSVFASASVGRSRAVQALIGRIAGTLLHRTQAAASDATAEDLEAALADLVTALSLASRRDTSAAARSAPAFDYRIRRAVRLLAGGTEPLRPDAIAREVGLSRPRFFELFKACTGASPARIGNAARMERAITLLAAGTVPVGEIAKALDFSTHGNFTRFFRSHIGLCPRTFRRNLITMDKNLPLAGPYVH